LCRASGFARLEFGPIRLAALGRIDYFLPPFSPIPVRILRIRGNASGGRDAPPERNRAFQELVRMSLSDRRWWCLLGLGLLLTVGAGCRLANGWAFNNSGKAYYQRGQYAMARDEFYRAALDDPYNPDIRNNLAMALKKTGNVAAAERVLRTNLTQVSAMHQPTYHTLAQLLAEQQRYAEAQDLLQGWTVAQPHNPYAHIELAWVQRQLGHPAAAEQSIRQALQLDPQNSAALAQMGQLYEDGGQPDRAAALYQRSLVSRWSQPQVQSRLQMIADGSARAKITRSALMQNPVAVQPTMVYGPPPTLATNSGMTISTARPAGDASAIMAAAPVLGPTPDPMSATIAAPVAAGSAAPVSFEAPIVAGPQPTPNADPAHAEPTYTAELPLVEPH
jgi:tetratricopeptide (TPR) repeat protein